MNFKIVLRGRVVDPHSVVSDLKYVECIKYKPQVDGITEVSSRLDLWKWLHLLGLWSFYWSIKFFLLTIEKSIPMRLYFWKLLHLLGLANFYWSSKIVLVNYWEKWLYWCSMLWCGNYTWCWDIASVDRVSFFLSSLSVEFTSYISRRKQ